MLINLWVRDKTSGNVHQVGTDIHDSVVGMENGTPTYYNLQNGCGTPEEYEWVEPPELDDYVAVTQEQLYLNRKMIHEDLMRMLKK